MLLKLDNFVPHLSRHTSRQSFYLCRRIEEIHTMLKEQSKILKAIGQREGVEETGNRKSIIGWFLKKH